LRLGGDFSVELIDDRDGLMVFKSVGDDELWQGEIGGHRVQRIPPTERKGRVHTSTITVAVLPEVTEKQLFIKDKDLDWQTCRSSGPGGQNVNKVESAVQLTYLPTKMMIRCEYSRDQHRNRVMALELLRAKLWEQQKRIEIEKRIADRKEQIGSGARGDKRRTVAYQRGEVVDHITGKRWKIKEYIRGNW